MPAEDDLETRGAVANDGTGRQPTLVVEVACRYNSAGRVVLSLQRVGTAAAPVGQLSFSRGSIPEQALDEGSLAGVLQVVG